MSSIMLIILHVSSIFESLIMTKVLPTYLTQNFHWTLSNVMFFRDYITGLARNLERCGPVGAQRSYFIPTGRLPFPTSLWATGITGILPEAKMHGSFDGCIHCCVDPSYFHVAGLFSISLRCCGCRIHQPGLGRIMMHGWPDWFLLQPAAISSTFDLSDLARLKYARWGPIPFGIHTLHSLKWTPRSPEIVPASIGTCTIITSVTARILPVTDWL